VNKRSFWDRDDNWGLFIGVNQSINAFTAPRITFDGVSGFGVARWGRTDCVADLTTAGESESDDFYGVPDGIITAADISFYVNLWAAGCP